MKKEMLSHLNDPKQLEKLYRTDKPQFTRAFRSLYPEIKEHPAAEFWHERLHYESDEIQWGKSSELLFVAIACVIAGFIAKLPGIFSLDEEFFYPRNIGFIVFPTLTAFFLWKKKMPLKKTMIVAGIFLVGALFINLLPNDPESDTLTLACIHLTLFLWCILGYGFVGGIQNHLDKRLDFLKYNGELAVMAALLLIAGGMLTGITMGLFSLLGIDIEEFYSSYVAVFALPAVPIIGTYLTQTNPQLVGRVSPVIAKIFSPLVLLMLVIYLVAMAYSGKDPYNDREFLLFFNLLLIGVMAIIFFSVAETSKVSRHKLEFWVLFLLSIVTILVNGVALSAILFRISEWGITPNRVAVLGGNVLILIHLLLVAAQIYRTLFNESRLTNVRQAIVSYLPVYFLWTIIVIFVFPFVFGFR